MIVSLVVAPWLVVAQPASADTTAVAVGACVVTLDVSGNYSAIPPTSLTTLNITGGGTCVVNGAAGATIDISGSVQSVGDTSTWTCAGGVAEGQLLFSVTHPKFPSGITAGVVVSAELAAVEMVATTQGTEPAFEGVGAFVRDTASLTACPAAAPDMTWCGPFEFTRATAGLPPVRS